MAYRVRYTKAAREDLHRLFRFLLEHDIQAAQRARDAIAKAADFLQDFPFACRKADADNPFLRELLRHQREDDYL